MAATEFAAQVRHEAGVAVLDLSGDVSSGAEQKLLAAYAQAGEAGIVLLDFTDVDYINSTGIALIVGLLAQARAAGQEVQARGLAEHYREIFRITRLSDFMTILDDEGDET
jgi:anti-sigma B factor antagonist